MRIISDVKPTMSVGKTNVQIASQGYTYNESGITYNEVGVQYGGLYGYDTAPLISMVYNVYPRIMLVGDFQGTVTAPNSGMLMGILGLTYP